MNADEQDENSGATRAGGPVITKGPSHKADDTAAEDEKPDASEPGTRAGGPVITKGPSQKQPESSQ